MFNRHNGDAIVVVGGTSFIGSHLLPRLVANGSTVHATCRTAPPATDVPGVRWLPGDLGAPDATAAWPARSDTVIYLAQSRKWRQFPEGAADVFDVNVAAVFRAAEYARRSGATRFVFASTGSIYDAGEGAARERDRVTVTNTRHFYVAAKLSAELLLGAYAALMTMVVLRLFVPYGPGQAASMLIPQLVRKVREGEPILLDGDDGLLINPVAVGDVAEAIVRCLDAGVSTTINVAGPEVLSLRQICQAIGRVLGSEATFEARPGNAQVVAGDTTRLREVLGWAPATTFAAGLEEWLGSNTALPRDGV